MRDATYVILALALCMIASIFIVHLVTAKPEPNTMSIFDLKEFSNVPLELRAVLRRMMFPDTMVSKQKWAALTPQQKQAVIDHISTMFHTQQLPPKEEVLEPPILPPPPVVAPEIKTDDGMKKGFLLTETKKSQSKNKKKDKSETLVQIVASPEEAQPLSDLSGGDDQGFLGRVD